MLQLSMIRAQEKLEQGLRVRNSNLTRSDNIIQPDGIMIGSIEPDLIRKPDRVAKKIKQIKKQNEIKTHAHSNMPTHKHMHAATDLPSQFSLLTVFTGHSLTALTLTFTTSRFHTHTHVAKAKSKAAASNKRWVDTNEARPANVATKPVTGSAAAASTITNFLWEPATRILFFFSEVLMIYNNIFHIIC